LEAWLRPEADLSPRLISLGFKPGAGSDIFMYYVYILKSKKNSKLYKGFTNDLKRIIKEHNLGKSVFTKNNGPWSLIYYECFLSKIDAEKEELFLKSGKGKERIKFLLKDTLEIK
jgi:putative endonuclease